MPQENIRITIKRPGPVVLGPCGGALGIEGFVHGRVPGINELRLFLSQGECRVEAERVFVQDGLLGPAEPGAHMEAQDRLDGGFYASAVFPFSPRLSSGSASLEAVVSWRSSDADDLFLSPVDIVSTAPLGARNTPSKVSTPRKHRIGIAMATFQPNPVLFARQIASIRAQTWRDWICVISDDGSTPDRLRQIAAEIADDDRFCLLPPAAKLGFYRNFERACATLLPNCDFLALSDQDDAWAADRLERQLEALTDAAAACSYSDVRVVDAAGTMLSESFWLHRRPEYGSLSGLLLGNVVTGMTILATRDLLRQALPFPATPNLTYHDHWIGLVAARAGGLRYLPEPLVQYVQHGNNHTGALVEHPRSHAVLAQALRRIGRFGRIGLAARRPLAALREPFVLDWLDREPARLRILADRLAAGSTHPPDPRVARLTRRFGLVALVTCGAAWGDRYRRAYAIELWLGAVLRRSIARRLRAGLLWPEAGLGAAGPAPATACGPPRER